MASGKILNLCRKCQQNVDVGVSERLLRFVSAMADAAPTWFERMITLMRQTCQQEGMIPKPKSLDRPQPLRANQVSEQIFTGPKGGQYVLTVSGKKRYLKK